MLDELPVWRLVTDRVASLEEIERGYTFRDICRANAVLDMKSAIETEVNEILIPRESE